MPRTALTLLVAAGLSAWASAQVPAPGPTAAEQLKLLTSNRKLLEDLIDSGLKLSDANTALDRAAECRRAAGVLSAALTRASADPTADPDRLAELSDHLGAVLRDGLAPSLAEARSVIPRESQDFQRLEALERQAADDAAKAAAALPTAGKVGQTPQVRDARGRLKDAGSVVGGAGR